MARCACRAEPRSSCPYPAAAKRGCAENDELQQHMDFASCATPDAERSSMAKRGLIPLICTLCPRQCCTHLDALRMHTSVQPHAALEPSCRSPSKVSPCCASDPCWRTTVLTALVGQVPARATVLSQHPVVPQPPVAKPKRPLCRCGLRQAAQARGMKLGPGTRVLWLQGGFWCTCV